MIALLLYALIRYLIRTPFGIALQGVRDEPVRMSSLGYSVALHRTLAFAFGAFMASIAGVLFVWWNGHVDPQTIGLGATINVLIIAVIGGLRRIEGAFVGALAYVYINDRLAETDFSVGGHQARHVQLADRPRSSSPSCSSRPTACSASGSASSALLQRRPAAAAAARRLTRPPPSTSNLPGIVPTRHKGEPHVNLSRLRKLKYALPLAALVMACTAGAATAKPTAAGTPIKIAILSDCKGAFAAFYGADVGGAIMAFVEQTGAKVEGQEQSDQGHDGRHHRRPSRSSSSASAARTTPPTSPSSETKRLMEKLKADILIGPLSGDEGVAIAKYAKAHPKKTFVNGTSGALDTTMIVRAPNFFRWNGDGAQWNAGTGWVAYNVLGWRKVDVIDGQLLVRLDVGRRVHRRVLRARRQGHQARARRR